MPAAATAEARGDAGGPGGHSSELGRRFVAGDPEALRELYERFAGPVFTVVMSRLSERALAEEAVQDVFVKAWRFASTFDPQREAGPWLYQIARRTAADMARRERRRPTTTALPPSLAAEETGQQIDPWEAWEIRRALQQLTTIDRELLRLAHHSGLTHIQIGHRLCMPVGTVKSRLHRAHRRLAGLLGHLRA